MDEGDFKDLIETAEIFISDTDRDLLVFSGPIDDETSEQFIRQVVTFKERREKVTLFLCTYGGDPHAAYRMTRVLRRCYPADVRILIGGYCKSAGTLVALSADSLGFSEVGELGPLDTQISQRDEVLQMASGLEVFSTLQYLTDHAFACFEKNMLSIVRKSGQSISTRLASEIATNLATGLINPITAQLDPNRIGIARRGLEVTKTYGRQLANRRNLKGDAVEHLVNDYPTHAFVIDQEEAKTLFKNVDNFSEQESEIYEQLRDQLTIPNDQGFIINFSSLIKTKENIDASATEPDGETSPSDEGKSGSTGKAGKGNRKPVEKSSARETDAVTISADASRTRV